MMVHMPRAEASLANLEVFCRTFELGSFTRAAVALGLTPQAASRALARLEQHLGATLFRRSTRKLEPTDAGRGYYARSRQALDLLATGARELATDDVARGTVRISVGTPWAHHQLLPALARFSRTHPGVSLVVHLDHRNIDFVRDGFDVAIRVGTIRDQSLVARSLGDHAVGLFAAPSYLAQHPAPRHVTDLARHRCIGFVVPGSGRLMPWELAGKTVAPTVAITVQGDPLGAITLAREGAGIVQTYDFVVARALSRGELVEVLPSARGSARRFSLLYPRGVIQPPAVKAVVAAIVQAARADGSRSA